jgi:hypothetical protein
MSMPFQGVINVDIRDSKPDWAPFEPPKAPDGAPSVVYIVLDDVGFSALGCYAARTPRASPPGSFPSGTAIRRSARVRSRPSQESS